VLTERLERARDHHHDQQRSDEQDRSGGQQPPEHEPEREHIEEQGWGVLVGHSQKVFPPRTDYTASPRGSRRVR
jgi:hypothetical protein